MRQDFVNNGTDRTIGNFEVGRIQRLIDIVTPILVGKRGDQAGLQPQDLYTNEFIDPSIGIGVAAHMTPKIAPSLRGERIPVEQIPVVDFTPSGPATPTSASRRPWSWRAVSATSASPTWPATGSTRSCRPDLRRGRAVLALLREKKAEVAVEKSNCDRGWFDIGMENLDPDKQEEATIKEGYRIGNDLAPDHPLVRQGLPFHGPNQWPTDVPGFRETMEAYFAAVHGLARQVTHAVAVALRAARGLLRRLVRHAHGDHEPAALPAPGAPDGGEISEARIGAGAHSDYGCLALLAQDDRGGLQVFNAAGQWIDAKPVRDVRGQRGRHAGPLDQRPVPADPAPGHQHLWGRARVDPLLL